ncbi:hypothetical protein EIP91_001772 [Steccherinum ochraceum]|uniref:2-dehydropantoate 2-reductase n=1 Tax=Steccherinum ochraceum TaxID=92696 RepID=A0A4R0RTL8_9APHY|nr:hypothetical protein EIP91_001772 [Steccherinum ochraceum]
MMWSTVGIHLEGIAISAYNDALVQDIGIEFQSDRLGSTTEGPWKPYRVVRTIEEAADTTYAFIVLATKCIPEVLPTEAILSPLLSHISSTPATSPTTIVLLQNGIGIEDKLLAYLASANDLDKRVAVVSGCAWVDATSVDGGRKVTQFGNERLVLGAHKYDAGGLDGEKSLQEFCDILKQAGANAVPVDDIDAARWRKVLWNASFSTICTLTRTNVGHVLALQSGRDELAAIMHEVLTVARASLSSTAAAALPDTVVQDVINNENPKSVFKPSMLVDLEAGRPMEVEAIVGGVLRKAQTAKVHVPKLELIYTGLSLIQRQILETREKQSQPLK